jgi:phenylacetaldehyde dehydrogenase
MNIAQRITIDPAAKSYVSQPRKILIDGEWLNAASGKTFPVYDPSTGEVLANVAEADAADVDKAVRAARKAFDQGPWPRMSPSERGRLLWKLSDLIEKHAEEFATLEALDNGKPLTVARIADVPLTIDMFRYMAGWATKITGTTIPISFPGEYLSYTLREPVGVVGQIIPWNFPLLMAAWKLAPALATGCTVVLNAAVRSAPRRTRGRSWYSEWGGQRACGLWRNRRCCACGTFASGQDRVHRLDGSGQIDRPGGRWQFEKGDS